MRCCDLSGASSQDAESVRLNRGGADVARGEADGTPNLVLDLDGGTREKLVSEGWIEWMFSQSGLTVVACEHDDLPLIEDLLTEGELEGIGVAWAKKPKGRDY